MRFTLYGLQRFTESILHITIIWFIYKPCILHATGKKWIQQYIQLFTCTVSSALRSELKMRSFLSEPAVANRSTLGTVNSDVSGAQANAVTRVPWWKSRRCTNSRPSTSAASSCSKRQESQTLSVKYSQCVRLSEHPDISDRGSVHFPGSHSHFDGGCFDFWWQTLWLGRFSSRALWPTLLSVGTSC